MMDFLRRLCAIWRPEIYQGWGRRHKYFEGWYFKVVSYDGEHVWAFIPGISYGEDPHAFLQVVDGVNASSQYHRFALQDFSTTFDRFSVTIGGNQFSADHIMLALPEVQGTLKFSQVARWQGSLFSPGIMGWYSFVPFMQCNHGLVSLDHLVHGKLTCGQEEINFDKGRGYIEKDWGSSFPKSWIWTQCNHYRKTKDLSVMASIAHIPWITGSFIGFLAMVWNGGKIKVFTTYSGARMHAKLEDQCVHLRFADREGSLEITARQAPGADLMSPIAGNMTGKVNESIQARHLVTYRTAGGVDIQDEGHCAGLEIAGDAQLLLTG